MAKLLKPNQSERERERESKRSDVLVTNRCGTNKPSTTCSRISSGHPVTRLGSYGRLDGYSLLNIGQAAWWNVLPFHYVDSRYNLSHNYHLWKIERFRLSEFEKEGRVTVVYLKVKSYLGLCDIRPVRLRVCLKLMLCFWRTESPQSCKPIWGKGLFQLAFQRTRESSILVMGDNIWRCSFYHKTINVTLYVGSPSSTLIYLKDTPNHSIAVCKHLQRFCDYVK